MSANAAGTIFTAQNEWGRKPRKHEAANRGVWNRARRESIVDQLAGLDDSDLGDETDDASWALGDALPAGVTLTTRQVSP